MHHPKSIVPPPHLQGCGQHVALYLVLRWTVQSQQSPTERSERNPDGCRAGNGGTGWEFLSNTSQLSYRCSPMVDDGWHQAKRRKSVAPSRSSEFASTAHMQKPQLDRRHISGVKQTAMLDQCQQWAPLPLQPPALWHLSHRQGQTTEHDPASIKTQEALETRRWESSLPSPSPSDGISAAPLPSSPIMR